MRIGYEASSIRNQLSGVGFYTASLLNALCALFPNEKFAILSHLGQSFAVGNQVATQKHSFPIKEIWLQLWVPRIAKRYYLDICHFTNSIAPLCFKSPYVVTLHDLSLIRHPEWHPRSRRLWMARILRPSILRASGVLCDSDATREDLISWLRLDESRIWVVPLAARPSFFVSRSEKEKQAVRERYGLRRPFLLYVGNIEPRKNLSTLLQAFRMLNSPGIDLVIAGRLAWLWKDILAEAQHPQIVNNVHLLNYVREDDLPALYQAALAFVYPSLMEGFGLPVLEAMASGTPVVVSNIEPLSSMVGEAGWLVSNREVDHWRSTLLDVISQCDKRRSIAAAGRERATLYGWNRVARETMQCYEKALSGRQNSMAIGPQVRHSRLGGTLTH